ncbi:MAG: hypothetical protein ACLTDV_16030 [Eubacterium sp.]
MIAMPFHPSNTYTIEEVNANLEDILAEVEKNALVSLDGAVEYKLRDKIRNGKLYVDQGIIAGCAGGGFENICAAARHSEAARASDSDEFYTECSIRQVHADLYGTGKKWCYWRRSYGDRCYREVLLSADHASVLAIRLNNNAIQHPSFDDETSRNREGSKAAERPDRFRSSDGCPFYRGNRCKQRDI